MNHISDTTSSERILFLDKIRYTLVLGVVVLHAACAYCTIIPWWPVLENDGIPVFDLLILTLDIYQMPVLYFIAGYFALSSMARYGINGFVVAKLKRLGVPFVLVGLFFVPIMPYIAYALHNESSMNFFQFWVIQATTVLGWHWVHITSPEMAQRYATHFSQWHLWFISLLLFFFLITAALAKSFPQIVSKNMQHAPNRPSPVLPSILIVVIASTIVMAVIHRFSPDWTWAKIGGLVLVQPTRLPIHAGFYFLGIHAYRRGWFSDGPIPLSPWIWLTMAGLTAFMILAVLKNIGERPAPIPWVYAWMHSALRLVSASAFLGFLLSAGQRWGQRETAVWRALHPASYHIYLIHLPLVVLLQWAAISLPISAIGKFVVVSLAGVGGSYAVSRGVIQPKPVVATGLLLAGFVVASAMLR